MLKLLPLMAMLVLASPAEAHQRNHRHHNGVWINWHASRIYHPRVHQPRIRVNRNCIYKPWTNKVICRY